MPPRLPLTLCQRVAQRHAHTLAFACPVQQRLARVRQSLQQQPSQLQRRESSILAQLSDTAGAYHKRIRRGRGPASGKGKTSGRGHKGQKQHGKVPRNFNGGQTPDIKVSGPRGKKNIYALKFSKINLDNLQSWIDQGRIDPTRPITMRELHHSRLTHGIKDGVKLLARNAETFKTPIHITVSQASAGAIAAIESAGGTITARYYTRASIKRVLKGESHPTLSLLSASPPVVTEDMLEKAAAAVIGPKAVTVLNMPKQNPHDVVASAGGPSPALLSAIRAYRYRLPDPSRRTDLEYYRDPAKRGYLSYQLAEGQSPSLFYKSPTELLELKRARDERKRVLAEGGADGGKDNEDKMRLF